MGVLWETVFLANMLTRYFSWLIHLYICRGLWKNNVKSYLFIMHVFPTMGKIELNNVCLAHLKTIDQGKKKDLWPNYCHFKFNTGDYCLCVVGLKLCVCMSASMCVCTFVCIHACVCMRACACMCVCARARVCACTRVWSLAFRVKLFLPAMSIFFNLKKILLVFTKNSSLPLMNHRKLYQRVQP